MRGNPFLRVAVAMAVFLLLGIPVWRVTCAQAAPSSPVPAVTAAADEKTTVHVSFEFEEAPTSVTLTLNGEQRSFLTPDDPLGNWSVTLPKEGADFIVQATWPTPTRHVLAVKISAAGFPVAEKTLWSDGGGTLKDVVSLEGRD